LLTLRQDARAPRRNLTVIFSTTNTSFHGHPQSTDLASGRSVPHDTILIS